MINRLTCHCYKKNTHTIQRNGMRKLNLTSNLEAETVLGFYAIYKIKAAK